MIWPFKRKSKVVDRRVVTTLRPGDMAICINGCWEDTPAHAPEEGDVLLVTSVYESLNQSKSVRAIFLRFKSINGFGWESSHFRKLVEQDDAALITRIKSLSQPKERV